MAGGREALLVKVVEHLGVAGTHDLSLRGLAGAVGSSHRMLLYHFGSQQDLLAAVVTEVEARQQTVMRELAADPGLSLGALAHALWQRLSEPDLRPLARLFFGLYTRALSGGGPVPAEAFVLSWLAPTEELLRSRGLSAAQAQAVARLGLAVTRGLLLDLLATSDTTGVDAAMALHVGHLDALEARAQAQG